MRQTLNECRLTVSYCLADTEHLHGLYKMHNSDLQREMKVGPSKVSVLCISASWRTLSDIPLHRSHALDSLSAGCRTLIHHLQRGILFCCAYVHVRLSSSNNAMGLVVYRQRSRREDENKAPREAATNKRLKKQVHIPHQSCNSTWPPPPPSPHRPYSCCPHTQATFGAFQCRLVSFHIHSGHAQGIHLLPTLRDERNN